jgi:hypothetical protein
MSQIDRMMDEHEEHRAWGAQIALEAGVLKRCKFHDCVYYADGEIIPAYKLGNYKFTKGELSNIFSERTEMTDAIKGAVEDAALSCWVCDKIESE